MSMRINLGLKGQTETLVRTLIEQGYEPKDVIYDALSVFDFALQEIAGGKSFGSFDPKTKDLTVLVTPILQEVRKDSAFLEKYLSTYGKARRRQLLAR